jgi:redox-sensitive bicupin YhaK (pirin superfamily)
MKWILRRSEERGFADHGWLKSWHSFSFANYDDVRYRGFRCLRVINQDIIAPRGGFPTHPHRNMEIFTYMLKGSLQHRDSMGNGAVLRPGEIQVMSAGSGVTHSEFNPSADEEARLLQIWIEPRQPGLRPRYSEWQPQAGHESLSKLLIISGDGREGSAMIAQDASVYRLRFKAGEELTHELGQGRGCWLQVITGSLRLGDHSLGAGDAAHGEGAGPLEFKATEAGEALLFDLS